MRKFARNKKAVIMMSILLLVFLQAQGVVFAEQAEVRLDEMVVTGTKSERLLIDVPVRTEVITSEELERKGAVNLYEALDGNPGLRVEQQCSYCNFTQLRMQGLEAGHVQILIDGQPVYSGLASVYGLQQIPIANIDRIEIVKGAGSALYGSSAIAGVVNVITKKPARELDEKAQVQTSMLIGEDGARTVTLNAACRLGKRADVILTAMKNSENEIDEDDDKLTDRVWSNSMTGSFRVNYYELAGNDEFSIAYSAINEFRKGGDLTDNAWKNAFAEASEHIDTRRNDYRAGYTKAFSLDNEISLLWTYATHERDATNDTFVGDYLGANGVYPGSNLLSPYIAKERNYTLDFSYAHPISNHRILSGVQFANNELNESGMYVRASGAEFKSDSSKDAEDLGFYVQDEWGINDRVELVIGGRYDTHTSEDTFAGSADVGLADVAIKYDESAFNPRAALMIKASPELTFRTSVGTGFRVPYSFSEDLHLCSGSPRVYKGENLEPEKSVSYTVSADYTQQRYMVSASVFKTEVEKKIDIADASTLAAGLGYDYEWENMGDSYTQGIEVSGEVLAGNNVSIQPYLTYTDAKYKNPRGDWADHPVHGIKFSGDSEHISRVPDMTGGLELAWTPETWAFYIDTDWTGKMYIDYNKDDDVEDPGSEIVHTDSFWLVGVKIARTFPELGLTTFIGAKNLFDELQTDKRPDDAAFMYKPYTGRVVYAGLKVIF